MQLLPICLLKGFHCHLSRSFAPKFSYQYETDKWIIRLLFLTSSSNPNEKCVLEFLRPFIDRKFINKDIVFHARITSDTFDVFEAEEFDETKLYFQGQEDGHFNKLPERGSPVGENELFYVTESLISNAGFGLFSKKVFHRGETLLEFKGTKFTSKDFRTKYPHSKNCKHHEYSLSAESFDRQKFVFDPLGTNDFFDIHDAIKCGNFGPFINEPQEGCIANCETVSTSNVDIMLRVDVVATRTILPNDEILMLYNRKPEKDAYVPGVACPSPLEMKAATTKRTKATLFCPNMLYDRNEDYFRLFMWEQEYEQVVAGDQHLPPRKNCVVFTDSNNYVVDLTSCAKMVVPFRVHGNDINDIYKRFLFTKDSQNLTINKCDKFFHDSYESRQLDPISPYVAITANTKTCFTRFRDVWTSEDIVRNTSIDDDATVEWLQNYGNAGNTHHVPESKPKTKIYISGLKSKMTK